MNINEPDVLGNTPLINACIRYNFEIAKTLVELGAKLDIQNFEKKTALMIACEGTNFDIIKLLVENGADFDIRDECGNTALMNMFFGRVVDKYNDMSKHLEILKFFLRNGYKIDIQRKMNETELSAACYGNSTDAAIYLIDIGANVNAIESELIWTPLKHAIENKNKKLIDYLKNHNAITVIPQKYKKNFIK